METNKQFRYEVSLTYTFNRGGPDFWRTIVVSDSPETAETIAMQRERDSFKSLGVPFANIVPCGVRNLDI